MVIYAFRFTEKTLDLEEETNFYFGPSNQVLIRLGAKYTPCMRRDKQIYDIIDCERNLEKDTACCVNAAVRYFSGSLPVLLPAILPVYDLCLE